MGETGNISKIAERAFADIFDVFGWQQRPPTNTEWGCVSQHKHAPPKNKKHPTDAVYCYDDPYRPIRIYVNIDFKSYAKASIDSLDIAAAMRSLANTTECANKSKEFQDRFYSDDTGETVGLLFVYNHDNAYDPPRFRAALTKVATDALDVAKGRRLFIFGPDNISYLATLANDIRIVTSKKDVKDHETSFFYPNLVRANAISAAALSLESLTGPWQILKMLGAHDSVVDKRYHIYYRATGETVEEFEYLIDYVFRYQLLDDKPRIYVRLQKAASDAAKNFDRAKQRYLGRLYDLPEIAERLDLVTFLPVSVVRYEFSDIEIGMRRERVSYR